MTDHVPPVSTGRRRVLTYLLVALLAAAVLAAVVRSGRGGSGEGADDPAPTMSLPEADTVGDQLTDKPGLRPLVRVCPLPRFGLRAAAQERFVTAALDCLDKMWRPVLEDALFDDEPAHLKIVTRDTDVPCSEKTVTATDAVQYCGYDRTVYWPVSTPDFEGLGPGDWRWVLFVVMHEYGHHVQELTAVFVESHDERLLAADEDAENLVGRREELQAQCLAGASLRAAQGAGVLSRSQARAVLDGQDTGEGTVTHGSGPAYRRWATEGWRAGGTTVCDTWSVPADEVS
ncbi:hypothetical protein SRB5_26540 [Streptomyces sp. RB5]|uniref:Metalloprotease n=1 Tax=Streptomyces smaragdinus TaxID=2585196 RepID=A0A7K0CGC3_9ACTN|nr:neutral zinc metallopeptidase [Streptomyces smaragdinus]MQY12519.1 hypothetical protein [Streptomyces smaragdinus]